MRTVNRVLLPVILAGLCVGGILADEDEWLRPLGPPPTASPRRISGGEGFPPLPLPVTPLRRSERKREPQPPTLAGKVVWGESASFRYEDGATVDVADWNQAPADIQQLLRKGGDWFGLKYAARSLPLTEFDGNPATLPLLVFNGGRSIRVDETQHGKLRDYVLQGGMILFDSIAGSPYFYASSRELTRALLPEFAIRAIPPEHPIHHMLYDVDKVRYPRNLDSDRPHLEGVYVGSRIGVLISRYGLGCGWDDREVPLIEKAVFYDVESANKIGLNLLAYAVGYAGAGREEAKPELFGALDEQRPTDEFVFAQIRHEGAWNVHPGSAAALLRRLRQDTSLRVSLKRIAVTPGADDLSGLNFLYLSGLDDFAFDEAAIAALRQFIRDRGTLLVDNGLGLPGFDAVARRELKRLLPEADLAPIPPEHPLYSAVYPVTEVRYSPAVLSVDPKLTRPVLEGVSLDGELRVIYSPFDLGASWMPCEYPLARAYESTSGMQLGVNIAMHAMTH